MTTFAPEPRTTTPVARPAVPLSAQPAAGADVAAHPAVVLSMIVAGAVAILALWWTNTPSMHGFGDWLTNAGRILGLGAGYTMVVLVVLMARIPPLERGIGADRLARWHAMGGRYSVCLVVAHALLITWGYAVTAHTNVINQEKTLLTSYPDVLMATVAGLLLVGVGVSSARKARRRLAYETWYFLHFYTYLAIALAFSHQFATGAEFVSNRPARVVWAGMYLAAGTAILWYRFVTPVIQAFRHQLRVEAVMPEGPGVVSIVVSGRGLNRLRAQSGQFFRWRFLTRDLWWVSSPYSLSAAPLDGLLRITVKDLGDHSRSLARLKPGTWICAEGPYGAMTAARRKQRKVLLIAGGVGITPLRALFQSIPARSGELTLLYRASSTDDLVFTGELEHLAAKREATVHFITGRRADFAVDPLGAAALKAGVSDLEEHEVFVCGPDGMTAAVMRALKTCGVRRRHIHHESFDF